MSVNTLTFEQISTILSSLCQQATGQTALTSKDTGDFVSVAQTTISAGYDAVMNAIGNVLGRTIFSIRPYNAKFAGLEKSIDRWGAYMRKLSIADNDWADDSAYAYPVTYDSTQDVPNGDGGTVDQWTIKKPNVLQTNFYGQSIYGDHVTITQDQLETAFKSRMVTISSAIGIRAPSFRVGATRCTAVFRRRWPMRLQVGWSFVSFRRAASPRVWRSSIINPSARPMTISPCVQRL